MNRKGHCYRNAVLQSLISLPEIGELCEEHNEVCKLKRSECVPCALDHLRDIYLYGDKADNLSLSRALLEYQNTVDATFDVRQPGTATFKSGGEGGGDSRWYLAYLLSLFQPPPIDSKKRMSEMTILFSNIQPKRPTRRPLFNLTQEVVWTCETCDRSFTFESSGRATGHLAMTNIFCPLPHAESFTAFWEHDSYQTGVEAPYDGSLSNDILELAMVTHGGWCQSEKHSNYTVRKTITEAPKVLFLTPADKWTDGVHDPTRYPEYLDLGKYTKDGSLRYRLQAVIGTGHNHAIAAVRQQDGVQFLTCNDDILKASWSEDGTNVMELLDPKADMRLWGLDGVLSFPPALIIYRKVSVSGLNRRSSC